MILRDRLNILDELMQSAKQVLEQYKSIAEVASSTLEHSKVLMQTLEPKELLDMYKRIHDMQMQSLTTFNNIIERFPVEHTIQELQLIELFRNLTERQKQDLLTYLERDILQKRR